MLHFRAYQRPSTLHCIFQLWFWFWDSWFLQSKDVGSFFFCQKTAPLLPTKFVKIGIFLKVKIKGGCIFCSFYVDQTPRKSIVASKQSERRRDWRFLLLLQLRSDCARRAPKLFVAALNVWSLAQGSLQKSCAACAEIDLWTIFQTITYQHRISHIGSEKFLDVFCINQIVL